MQALSWHTMEYLTYHLYYLGIHTRLKARVCVYRENYVFHYTYKIVDL